MTRPAGTSPRPAAAQQDTLIPVRFADGQDDDLAIDMCLLPFGGTFNGRDVYRTTFTAKTDFALDWFKSGGWPLLWHHALDAQTPETVRMVPIGRIHDVEIRADGGWARAQLDAQAEYLDDIKELIRQGKLYCSSGSLQHLVEIDHRTGEIQRWPLVEGSLTPTPANFMATVQLAEATKHYRAAGIDDLPLRAVWTTAQVNDLPDSAFAYVEDGEKDDEGKTTPRSKRHLPYKGPDGKPDAAHVRNALARLEQTDIPEKAKASAGRKLAAAAKALDIDVDNSAKKGGPRHAFIEHFDLAYRLMGEGKSAEQIRAAMDALEADGGNRSVIDDTELSYEDIIGDLSSLLNLPAPFGQGRCYTSILATYPGYVFACRYEYGDGDDYDYAPEQTWWKVAYSIGTDLEPVLGEVIQVEQVYLPVAGRFAALEARMAGPLSLEGQAMCLRAATFIQRTEDLGERRVREGRTFSAANRSMLADLAGRLDEAAGALRALLETTDLQGDAAAKAAHRVPPAVQRQRFDFLDLSTFVDSFVTAKEATSA